MGWKRVATLLLAAALGFPGAARAADPGRWTVTGTTTLPILYYQGVTVDPARNFYFDGVYVGLYRTDPGLTETGRTNDVIPPDVHLGEGYNHIGDIAWDHREGGRILLPLECYVPGGPNGGNPCLHGSIGVADPRSLQWRYYVKLDPAEIPKAMWNEVSPDGSLLWTSSGDDLLAYRTADITPAKAAPGHAPIHSVRRLPGAVPPSGITGATFIGDRMFVAGQGGGPFRVWSIDLATGERRLEIERTIVGESEGLVTADLKGGTLQWLIQPFNDEGKPPTYGPNHATLVSFGPPGSGGGPAPAPAPPASGNGSGRVAPRVWLLKRSRATVLARRGFAAAVLCPEGCTARLEIFRGRDLLARTIKRTRGSDARAARSLVRLTRRGRRALRTRDGRLRLIVRATVREPSGTVTRRVARLRLR
jgi:hypothetical protein